MWTAIAIISAITLVSGLLTGWRLKKRRDEKKKKAEQARKAKLAREAEEAREAKEAREAEEAARVRRQKKAKELVEHRGRFVDQALERANVKAEFQRADDEELVRLIAERLDEQLIDVMRIAGLQSELESDLEVISDARREPTAYPTEDIDPTPMSGFDQLPNLLPEHHAMPDEAFYHGLAHEELMVMQPFESRVRHILYILIDVSGSMYSARGDEKITSSAWARGVTLRLLMEALDNDARYFLRGFGDRPGPLLKATDADEAEAVGQKVLDDDFGDTGGGTHIFNAFSKAVEDIRTRGGDFGKAEILLISDAYDSTMDPEKVREMMGDDIKLHVVVIGTDSDQLKEVASSYRRL